MITMAATTVLPSPIMRIPNSDCRRIAREKVLRLCKPEWKKTCIWLNTDPNECKRREDRGRRPWLIDNCERCFQPPTYDEGWDEIIVVKDGKEGLLETSNTHSPLERGTVGDVPPAE